MHLHHVPVFGWKAVCRTTKQIVPFSQSAGEHDIGVSEENRGAQMCPRSFISGDNKESRDPEKCSLI